MSHSGKKRPLPTRNVVLTEQQAGMIERLVASGRYQNASEVLRDGLRLVQQREAEDAARLEALRQAASVGLADFADGRCRSFADGATLRDHLATRAGNMLSQCWQRAGSGDRRGAAPAPRNCQNDRPAPQWFSACTISSVIFFASPNSIIVFGRKNSSLSTPAYPDAIDRFTNSTVRAFSTSRIGIP